MTCKLLILPGSKKRPPNGAKRGPEAAWISKDRWERVPEELQEKLASMCPDFVIELVSPSDRSADVEEKMEEYASNVQEDLRPKRADNGESAPAAAKTPAAEAVRATLRSYVQIRVTESLQPEYTEPVSERT